MASINSRLCKMLLCSAAGVLALPAMASAGGRWDDSKDRDRRGAQVDVRIDISRDRFERDRSDRDHRDRRDDGYVSYEKRVWIDPVYRTVTDRVWVEPVYRDVCDRVWHEPVYEERCERVWVPERYEYRDLINIDLHGNRIRARERVCVEPGHYEERRERVLVSDGYWEDVRRREVVCEGYWKTIERRECVSEGYWTTKVVREKRNAWHGDQGPDRGRRYED